MLDICRCPNVDLAMNDHLHPCHEVVSVQKGTNEFQLPEPWTGDLDGSRLLIFASNPSIDESEAYPTSNWRDEGILNFFRNRFDEEYGWTKGGLHVLQKDRVNFAERVVRYWAEVKRQASRIYDFEARAGVDYTLTEVVHCKSRGRKGVSSASSTCGNLWLNRILDASGSRVLLILGDEAGEMLGQLLELDKTRILHRSVMCGSELRWVLFVPAPGSSKTRDIEKILNPSDLVARREWINESWNYRSKAESKERDPRRRKSKGDKKAKRTYNRYRKGGRKGQR